MVVDNPTEVTEVRDCYGRRYALGADATELIGRSRAWILWLAWAAMATVSVLQYGFGAVVPALVQRDGWGTVGTFWLLAVWAVFQAGVGFPTAHLRERDRLGARPVMIAGGLLCLLGLLSLAHSSSLPGALLGYSVLGGTGAGLIYAACTSTVAKWYPERMASRVSFVTGAFAYGSVPFILAVVLGADAGNLPVVLDAAGVLLCLVAVVAGLLFRDPPSNWWPPHIDPRRWALDGDLNPGRLRNVPAVRQFSAQQALRTTAMPVMYVVLLCAGAVSLFNAAFLVSFAGQADLRPVLVAVAAAVLVGVNGAGRALAVGISDRIGRCNTLGLVLVTQAVGQFGFAVAESSGTAVLLVAATFAGIGGGAFYPLFASLARDYFGEQSSIEVHALVYSAKAFGGLVGVGLVVFAVAEWGYPAVFAVAGFLSLGSAGLSRLLRRPGLPNTLPAAPSGAAADDPPPHGAWRWCP